MPSQPQTPVPMPFLLLIAIASLALSGCSRGYLCASDARARIADTMSIDEITRLLGPDYVDIGSGLHVLRYSFPDSSQLLIGGPSTSARPLYVNIIAPANASDTSHRNSSQP